MTDRVTEFNGSLINVIETTVCDFTVKVFVLMLAMTYFIDRLLVKKLEFGSACG